MEIKIKAVGKNVILDNEIVCKVAEGADLEHYRVKYLAGVNTLVSVDGDPTSEVHYHFAENLTETDPDCFNNLHTLIKEIWFPNFITRINRIVNLEECQDMTTSMIQTIKCGRSVNFIGDIFGREMELPHEVNLLLPNGIDEHGNCLVDLSELPEYHQNLNIWVPANAVDQYQHDYPGHHFCDISEYKEQA